MNRLGSRVYDALRVSICLSTDPALTGGLERVARFVLRQRIEGANHE